MCLGAVCILGVEIKVNDRSYIPVKFHALSILSSQSCLVKPILFINRILINLTSKNKTNSISLSAKKKAEWKKIKEKKIDWINVRALCKQLIIYYQNVRWKPVPVFDQIKRRYLRFLWWLVRNWWLRWGGWRILCRPPFIALDLFAEDFIVGVIRWFNKFCRFKNLISLQLLLILVFSLSGMPCHF